MTLYHGLSAFPITPADAKGTVDVAAMAALAGMLARSGVDSLGVLGSTGTYAYLTRAERHRAVTATVRAVDGRKPVIVGIGALRTDEAQDLARDALAAGADGLLMAPVSYTPLTQDEAFEHYRAVAQATSLPLCIYNNPGTTHFSFSRDLLERLSRIERIVAIKMPLPTDMSVRQEIEELRAGPVGRLAIGYSGDWGAAEALMAGADAWYSVAGGFLPDMTAQLIRAARARDQAEVLRLDGLLEPLWRLMKAFGSLRVAYAALPAALLGKGELPRPLLALPDRAAFEVRAFMAGEKTARLNAAVD